MAKCYYLAIMSIFALNCFSQNREIVFDFKITDRGKFESSEVISESFLKCFLNKNSSDFSDFYQLDIFCALIEEEIADSIPINKINKNELCNAEALNAIFKSTVEYKRELFYENKSASFSNIEIISFKQVKKPDIHTSKYKFDIYNLYLKFKNNNKIYELKMFEVYHINYKWFILDPDFEVL
jgi:hypothetical protein